MKFSKVKIIELAVCAVAVAAGLLYLNTDLVPLGVLLVLYSVFFGVIPILRWIDAKRAGGGFAAYLPVVCFGVLALFVIVATVAYFATQSAV